MNILTTWRKHLFGPQADNPQIEMLDQLNRFPEDQSTGGEKDTRWAKFAEKLERAVRELDDDFFRDLADAAHFLKGRNASPEAEATHYATLERLSAGNPVLSNEEHDNLIKGEIREKIIEMWAGYEPSEEDWRKAREKAGEVKWSRVWKNSGLAEAKQKRAGRPQGSKNR